MKTFKYCIIILLLVFPLLNVFSQTWPVPDSDKVCGSYSSAHMYQGNTLKQHSGIDIVAPAGSPVVAVYSGTIFKIDVVAKSINIHVLSNNRNMVTMYFHCDQDVNHLRLYNDNGPNNPWQIVGLGKRVSAGDIIAVIASSANSNTSFDHLHLGHLVRTSPSTFQFRDPLSAVFGNKDPGGKAPEFGPLYFKTVEGTLPKYNNDKYIYGKVKIIKEITDNMGHTIPFSTDLRIADNDAFKTDPPKNQKLNGVTSSVSSITYHIKDADQNTVFPINNNNNAIKPTLSFNGNPYNNAQTASLYDEHKHSSTYKIGRNYCYNLTSIIGNNNVSTNPMWWNTQVKKNLPWTGDKATINEQARFPDGKYVLEIIASDVTRNSKTEETEIVIDNFLPYIQKVEMTSGDPIYGASWDFDGSNLLQFSKNTMDGIVKCNEDLVVTITTSEAMKEVKLEIEDLDFSKNSTTPESGSKKKKWKFTIPSSTLEEKGKATLYEVGLEKVKLKITGLDLNDNELWGFTSNTAIAADQIPKRKSDGEWTVEPELREDTLHSVRFKRVEFKTSTTPSSGFIPNGTATVEITKGDPSYEYKWSNDQTYSTAFALSPKTYYVTVHDNTGCDTVGEARVNKKPRSFTIQALGSYDPNDIQGPSGYGEEHWISKNKYLPYTIRFENDAEFATASANRVVITHPIDENANMFSFRLGDFGFGDFIFQVPEGVSNYSKRLDVSDSLGVYVDFFAGIDVTKKEAFWIFQSIDPTTGLPNIDPFTGFLLINDSITHRGEGFVSFSIQPDAKTNSGDEIKAFADIIFDVNEAIRTNEAINLIDAHYPISVLDTAYQTEPGKIQLSWKGEDDLNGCGLNRYELYASINDQNYELIAGIMDTTHIVDVFPGNKYKYMVLGIDNVENTEPIKILGDTSIFLPMDKFFITNLNSNYCIKDTLTLKWYEKQGLGNINFEVSRDGINYNTIAENVDVADTTFSWIIPDTIIGDQNYFIRAVSYYGDIVIDTTNAFYIYPNLFVNTGPDEFFCPGDSVQVTAIVSGGNTPYEYSWLSTDGLNDPNIHNPKIGIEGEFIVTVLDNNGCYEKDTIELFQYETPNLQISGLNEYYCQDGATASLTLFPKGGILNGNGISDTVFVPSEAGYGTHEITYLYTDVNGCNKVESEFVTVTELPELSILNLKDLYCINSEPDTAILIPSGGLLSGNGIIDTVFDPTAAGVGIHQVIYSYTDDFSCTNSDTIYIEVIDFQEASITGLEDEYCLNANVDTAILLPIGGILLGDGIVDNTFNPVMAGVGIHEIVYSSAGTNACFINDTIYTTVNSIPIVSISGYSDEYCLNSEKDTLFLLPLGGLLTGNGITDSIFDATLAGAGLHEIIYHYTNPNSCENSDTAYITVHPLPEIQISGLETNYCINAAKDTAEVSPEGGELTGSGISGLEFDPAVAGTGVHEIVYSFTNVNGCTNSDTILVNVHSLPDPAIVGLDTLYYTTDQVVDLVGEPVGGIFTGNGVAGNTFDPAIAGVGFHTITYEYTNENGCSNIAEQELEVKERPPVTIILPYEELCLNADSMIISLTPKGGVLTGNGVIDTVFYPELAGTGIHELVYTLTENSNTFSDTAYITVYGLPGVTISGLASGYCLDANPMTVVTAPEGGILTGAGISGNIFDPGVAGTGIHEIIYTYSDTNLCENSDTVRVEVYPLPAVEILAYKTEMCIHAVPDTLTAIPMGGTFTGPGMVDSVFNPLIAGTGTHEIVYNYQDEHHCSGSDTVYITVNEIPMVSVEGLDSAYCIDALPVDLTLTPTGGMLSGPGIVDQTFNPNIAGEGSHEIIYSYAALNGCSNTDTATVVVNPLPNVEITDLDSLYCLNAEPFLLQAVPGGGIFSGTGITENRFYAEAAGLGTHVIDYVYTDTNSCTNQTNDSLTVIDIPEVSFTGLPQEMFTDNDPVTLTGIPTGGTFSGNGITGNTFNPSVAGLGEHQINYSYTSENGCSNFYTQTVVVGPPQCITGLASEYYIDDAPVTLTGNPEGGSFSGPGIMGNIFDPSVAGTGTHKILYNYTDHNGRDQVCTANVIVVEHNYCISGLNEAFCINENTVIMHGNPAGGTFNGSGVTDSIFDPSIAGEGTHLITYTYFDENEVQQVCSVNIEVNPLPVVSITGLNTEYLITDEAVTLVGQPEGGIFSGNGIDAQRNKFNPENAGVGTHEITYTYTDENSCLNTAMVSVTVLPLDNCINGLAASYFTTDTPVTLTGYPLGGTFSGNGITGDTFDPGLAGTGTHEIIYTYQGNDGRDYTCTAKVLVKDINACINGLNDSFCIDAEAVTLSGNPEGGSFTGPGITGNIFDPLMAGSGVHKIEYSYTDENQNPVVCSQYVEVNLLPEVSFNGLDSGYFVFDPVVMLVGLPEGGIFTGNGITGNTFNPQVAGIGIHEIRYEYTDEKGCYNDTSKLVTVNNFDGCIYGLEPGYCLDAPAIELHGNPGEGVFTLTGITGSTFNPGIAGVGTHEIVYTYTDENGREQTCSAFVAVYALPNVTITDLEAEYCFYSEPIRLNGLPYGGEFTGNGVTNGSFYTENAGVGEHQLTYTYTDTNSCTSSAIATTTVLGVPDVTFTGLAPEYFENSAQVHLTGMPSLGTYSGNGMIDSIFYPSLAGVGTHEITYIYIDANNCSNMHSQSVTVLAPVCIAGLNPEYFVTDDPATLAGNPSGGYFEGTGITGNQFDPGSAGIGTHQITYHYTDNDGRDRFCTKTVIVRTTDICFLGIDSEVCTETGPYTLTGQYQGTFSGSGMVGNVFYPDVAGLGEHIIAYNYTDDDDNSLSCSDTITVKQTPEVSITGLEPSYYDNDAPAVLAGTPSGGVFIGNGINGNLFEPNIAGIGTHEITYLYFSNGCTGDTTIEVTVYSGCITGLDEEYCTTSEEVLMVGYPAGGTFYGTGVVENLFYPTIAGEGVHYILYVYSGGDSDPVNCNTSVTVLAAPEINISGLDTLYYDNDPVAVLSGTPEGGTFTGNGISGNVFNPSDAGVGIHPVTYQFVSANGCDNQITINVEVRSNCISGLESQYYADDNPVSITGTPSGGTFSGSGVVGTTFNPSQAEVGINEITYTYSGGSCTFSVEVLPVPEVNLGADISILENESIILEVAEGPFNYLWSDGSTEPTLIVDGDVIGQGVHNYSVEISDANGRSDSDDINITVLPVCSSPGNVVVTEVASNSAMVSWEFYNDYLGFEIYYKNINAEDWNSISVESTSVTLHELMFSTEYELKVRTQCSNGYSEFSDPVNFTTTSSCEARGLSTTYEWIKKVIVKDFVNPGVVNNSSASLTGYEDFSHITFNMEREARNRMIIRSGYWNDETRAEGTLYFKAWIDYNQDGDFYDEDECIFTREYQQTGDLNGGRGFVVPADAKLGITKMRVAIKYGDYPDPCEVFDYGEVEDYTVNISEYTCNNPGELLVSDITTHSAKFTWDYCTEATDYYFRYRPLAGGSWIKSYPVDNQIQIDALESGTKYIADVRSHCNNSVSGWSRVKFTTNSYCESRGLNTNYEWIKRVGFKNFVDPVANHRSGASVSGYENYTDEVYYVEHGGLYRLILESGYRNNSRTENKLYFKAWIDYNHDGDFYDEGECILTRNHLQNESIKTGRSFVVPETAIPGFTRMRIAIKYGDYPDPCEIFAYGEVEDYGIVIGGSTCEKPVNLMTENVTLTSATINWDISSNATEYYLRYRPVEGGTWISQTTNTNQATLYNLQSNTEYKVSVRSNCGNSVTAYSSTTFVTSLAIPGSNEAVDIDSYFNFGNDYIKLYPNPNDGIFNLEISSFYDEEISIEMYDLLGNKVYQEKYINKKSESKQLNISNLPQGVYLIKTHVGDMKFNNRIVKR